MGISLGPGHASFGLYGPTNYKRPAMARAATFVLERASNFKNRVHEPTPEGYRDLMFTVAMQNGHVCEVQLHLAEIMAAKHSGAGHSITSSAV